MDGQADLFGESTEQPTNGEAQKSLFDRGEWWENEWQGMPEFKHNDLEPWKSIYVHFSCRSDMEAFSKLIGQKVTYDTRSLWYPEAEIGRYADKRYVDNGHES